LQTAEKIREDEHQITSALPIKREFEILFRTTFSHLNRIKTYIKHPPLVDLTSLFEKETQIKAFLETWDNYLQKNSNDPNFVPYFFQKQIETVIAATQDLCGLVNKYQDHELRLRQIAEEEKTQQRRKLLAAPEIDCISFGSTESGKTDKEIITTPVHSSRGKVPQRTPSSGKSFTQFPFHPVTGDGHNGSTSNEHVSDFSTSLL